MEGPPFSAPLQPVYFGRLAQDEAKIVRIGAHQGCSLAIDERWNGTIVLDHLSFDFCLFCSHCVLHSVWVWGGENTIPVCLTEFRNYNVEIRHAFYAAYNQLVVSTKPYGSYVLSPSGKLSVVCVSILLI